MPDLNLTEIKSAADLKDGTWYLVKHASTPAGFKVLLWDGPTMLFCADHIRHGPFDQTEAVYSLPVMEFLEWSEKER